MRRALQRRQDRRRKAIFLKFPSRRVTKLRWADFEWTIEDIIHEDRTTSPSADNIVLEVDRKTGTVIIRGLPDGLITITCYAVSQDRNTYLGIARCGETEGRIDNKATLRLTADNKIRLDVTPRNRALAPLRCIFGHQPKQP
jgi:hypothetical protein